MNSRQDESEGNCKNAQQCQRAHSKIPALAKVAKFTRLAALPDLSPGESALALTMKRSAIAELKLSQKALDYAKPYEDPEVEKGLVLYRLFRLPLPPV
jgi:hypothetical protein